MILCFCDFVWTNQIQLFVLILRQKNWSACISQSESFNNWSDSCRTTGTPSFTQRQFSTTDFLTVNIGDLSYIWTLLNWTSSLLMVPFAKAWLIMLPSPISEILKRNLLNKQLDIWINTFQICFIFYVQSTIRNCTCSAESKDIHSQINI